MMIERLVTLELTVRAEIFAVWFTDSGTTLADHLTSGNRLRYAFDVVPRAVLKGFADGPPITIQSRCAGWVGHRTGTLDPDTHNAYRCSVNEASITALLAADVWWEPAAAQHAVQFGIPLVRVEEVRDRIVRLHAEAVPLNLAWMQHLRAAAAGARPDMPTHDEMEGKMRVVHARVAASPLPEDAGPPAEPQVYAG